MMKTHFKMNAYDETMTISTWSMTNNYSVGFYFCNYYGILILDCMFLADCI